MGFHVNRFSSILNNYVGASIVRSCLTAQRANPVSHEQVGKILLCKRVMYKRTRVQEPKLSSKHIHMVQKLYPSHSS